jgi:large subunit ribosomal protein L25
MAERGKLTINKRSGSGKWAMRRLRAAGVVPGVVYGHGEAAVSVQMSGAEIMSFVRHGSRVLDLNCDGATETALIRDLQWDTFGQSILHVDFARVSADERIRVEVPVHVRGRPVGLDDGGVLSHFIHTVEIECLATEIPEDIRVDVRHLKLDQAIKIAELVVPAGVKVLADPEIVVAQVTKKVEEVVAAAPVEGEVAAAVEPEIVGRRVAEVPEEGAEKAKEKK